MAKPTCPTCKVKQAAKPGERRYRCPRCGTRFEVGYDGPASNDPERNFELTTERKSL